MPIIRDSFVEYSKESANNFMRPHPLIPLILIISTATTAFAQVMGPMDLAKRIFSTAPFPDLEKYSVGDYKGEPNGQHLKSGSETRFILLEQTKTKAVVAMTILDSAGSGVDTYLHFRKDSIWRLQAFRSLAMTNFIELAKNELEKMTSSDVEGIIEKSKNAKDNDQVLFVSQEDYEFQLGNAKLILELDENIIQHFLKNKAEFERIKEAALNELSSSDNSEERTINLVENLKTAYRKLFISSVSYGDYQVGGKCLSFSIGGMIDNTVGSLYVRTINDLPEMDDSRVIMIRKIGNGWYLYKTT